MEQLERAATGLIQQAEVSFPSMRAAGPGCGEMPGWCSEGLGDSFAHFHARGTHWCKVAKELAEVASTRDGPSSFHQVLLDCLRAFCETVQHVPVPMVSSKGGDPPKFSAVCCFRANRCLCSERGRAAVRIQDRIVAAVKAAYKTASERSSLVHSHVVLMLAGTAFRPRGPGGVMVNLEGQPFDLVRWFLVSDVLQIPWELSYLELGSAFRPQAFGRVPARYASGFVLDPPNLTVMLNSKHTCYTFWELPSALDPSYRWEASLGDVEFSQHLVGVLQPKRLTVRLRRGELWGLWTGAARRPADDDTAIIDAWAQHADGHGDEAHGHHEIPAIMGAADDDALEHELDVHGEHPEDESEDAWSELTEQDAGATSAGGSSCCSLRVWLPAPA